MRTLLDSWSDCCRGCHVCFPWGVDHGHRLYRCLFSCSALNPSRCVLRVSLMPFCCGKRVAWVLVSRCAHAGRREGSLFDVGSWAGSPRDVHTHLLLAHCCELGRCAVAASLVAVRDGHLRYRRAAEEGLEWVRSAFLFGRGSWSCCVVRAGY